VHVLAIHGIARAGGAALALGTAHPQAGALPALLVDADLLGPGTVLGLAVNRITQPGGTALAGRTLHVQAAGRQALFVHAQLSHPRTGSPDAVPGITLAARAGHALATLYLQAGRFDTLVIKTGKALRAVTPGAVSRQAAAPSLDAAGTAGADGAG